MSLKRSIILIYDDDAICCQATADVLRDAGYDVQIATHFEPALATLEGDVPVDLLLTDIVVPGGLDGLALARMATARDSSIKIIFVTGCDIGEAEKRPSGQFYGSQYRIGSFFPK